MSLRKREGMTKMIDLQVVYIRFFLNNGNEHHLVLDISSATVARMLIYPDSIQVRVSGIKIFILSGSRAKLNLVY